MVLGRIRRYLRAAGVTSATIAVMAAGAFAQVQHTPRTVLPAHVPKTASSIAPAVKTPAAKLPTLPQRVVPLWALPPLPEQTASNTAYFNKGAKRRMAANGATITFFADLLTTACSSAVGTVLPAGCDVVWQESNLPNGNYQDYFIKLNQNINTSSATSVDAGYTNNNGNFHCDEQTSCPANPTLTSPGTYVMAVYNTGTNKWVTAVYVTVGSVSSFATYADSAATTPQTQFTAAAGTNVYVNATGLVQGDNYVAYMESTAGPLFCEYIAPPGVPSATQGCDPTTSAGITAVVGAQHSAAITAVWPLSASVPTGTYAVVLYNLTTNTRIAMRQVSIKGSTGGSTTLTPIAGNAAVSAFLVNPVNPAPTPSTTFAFDNTSEQSDKAFDSATTGLVASHLYLWTIHDPTGYVENSAGPSNSTNTGGFAISPVNFSNTNAPSNFVGNVYTLQFQNQTTSNVDASQGYKILGYNVATTFTSGGTAIVLASGGTVDTGLVFTNDGDTLYGAGNSDTIRSIYFDTGGVGITDSFDGVAQVTTGTQDGFSCSGGYCQSTTYTDSTGVVWTVHNDCHLNPAKGECTIIATPAAGSALAVGANVTLANITFGNGVGSHCSTTCTGLTSILPTNGNSYSNTAQYYATNAVSFTNGFGTTYGGTASVTHYGYYDGTTVHQNQIMHQYNANSSSMTYTSSSPFTPSSNYWEEWAVTVNNTSTGGANITQLEINPPTGYVTGNVVYYTLDNSAALVGTNTWTYRNGTGACPNGAPAVALCLQTSGSNNGIAPNGGTQTIYVRFRPDPGTSYAYTDWQISAITPTTYPMAPAGSITPWAPNTSSYDSLATAGYSLNGNLITPAFSPTSQGITTTNPETINVTNASTAQDANPDYLDAITIDLPCANPAVGGVDCFGTGAAASYTVSPSTWAFLGYQVNTPVNGTTRYWFAINGCNFFANTAAGPPSSTPPATVYPANTCSSANDTASAIAPGATFSVTATMQAPAATGTVSGTMYAHGANGNGWSNSHTFNLSITSVAAAAGFTGAGGYPAATAVTSPNSPQVGADTSATNGNAYVYTIKNNSAAAQKITSAIIEIPGQDISSVTPNDGTSGGSGTPWTIVGTPSIVGNAYGCTLSAQPSGTVNGITYNGTYSASNTGSNGGIALTGCSIPAGSTITIDFNAKAPYTVNDSYRFTTTVNSNVTAAENWSTDTIMQIIETASLSVLVNPSNYTPADASYSVTPTVSCAGCGFNQATNTIDFGAVNNSSSKAGQDVLLVSINTDAGPGQGWQLYVYCSGFSVGTSCNPATTGGAFSNQMVTKIDNQRAGACTNNCEPKAGMAFNNTAYAIVPTTSPGLEIMNTGSGLGASRDGWQALVDLEINLGTEAKGAGNKSTIVYTFIGN